MIARLTGGNNVSDMVIMGEKRKDYDQPVTDDEDIEMVGIRKEKKTKVDNNKAKMRNGCRDYGKARSGGKE
ncbi:conserved hypothetical protein [Ricinus communis]|uniref:Uncharacterized protein n=1 Tax=Ricinus communis TaxID=3988 RepID=B9T5I8_RICCO|nr:conserved hypothetical protein [Ricinus communis]